MAKARYDKHWKKLWISRNWFKCWNSFHSIWSQNYTECMKARSMALGSILRGHHVRQLMIHKAVLLPMNWVTLFQCAKLVSVCLLSINTPTYLGLGLNEAFLFLPFLSALTKSTYVRLAFKVKPHLDMARGGGGEQRGEGEPEIEGRLLYCRWVLFPVNFSGFAWQNFKHANYCQWPD